MAIPMKTVINCETGVVAEIPLSDEEMAQMEADAVKAAEEKAIRDAEEAAKAAAKSDAFSKLAALGLTDEELKALIP